MPTARSEENTKKELLDVIKMQIQGDTSQINVNEYSGISYFE